MVAFVTGSGLGLLNTSGSVLGGRGQIGSSALGRGNDNVYVNAATGNLIVQGLDEILTGRGPDSTGLRTYNSQGLFNDDNADNWTPGAARRVYNLTGTVNTAGSTITRRDESGAETVFAWNATDGNYQSFAGAGALDVIRYSAATNEYTFTDGDSRVKETYSNVFDGRITQVTDTDNNSLTFAYNAVGLVSSVTTANGEVTTYDYSLSTNRLTAIRTESKGLVHWTAINEEITVRTRYEYDAIGRLASVILDLSPEDNFIGDGDVFTTTYTYEGTSKRLASITETDGSALAFAYVLVGGEYRVQQVTQAVADGVTRVTTLAYDTVNRNTTITDALGFQTVLTYDAKGQLTQIQAPSATAGATAQAVKFDYDQNGNVTSATDAANKSVAYTYDSRGNQTLQRDAAGNTVTRTFSTNNQLLTETVYFTADPDGAGAGEPTQPATTRYVYDTKDHLRYVVSAEGRVTEYKYNGFGQQAAVTQYSGDFYAVGALAVNATISEIALDIWKAGLADLSKAVATEFLYDFRGNLSSTFQSDVVGANGWLASRAGQYSRENYVYDEFGNLLQRISSRDGAGTAYAYDGLGRVLVSTESTGRGYSTILYTHDDAGNKTTLTLAGNGLRQISTYNRAGELVSYVEVDSFLATLSETKYFYDALGRLRMTQDPTGVRSHILYDNAGRKVADIDGLSALTEYVYNENNQVTETIQYTNPVSPFALDSLVDANGQPVATVSLASVRPSNHSAPGDYQILISLYDDAGRLKKNVDSSLGVTEYFYDGASRLVKTTRYGNVLDFSDLYSVIRPAPTLANTVPNKPTEESDRATRYFYSADGLLIGELDAEGYLVEHKYDAAGYRTQTIKYAERNLTANRDTDGFEQLRPGFSSRDVSERYVYDARGLLRVMVDGEGYGTAYTYDERGNLASKMRSNRKLDQAALFDTPTSNVPITFQARGSMLDGAWPSISVRVDGAVVATVSLDSTELKTYTVNVPSLLLGANHTIDFVYTNDIAGSGDRDAWIDLSSITLGGLAALDQFALSQYSAIHFNIGTGDSAFDGYSVIGLDPAATDFELPADGAIRISSNAANRVAYFVENVAAVDYDLQVESYSYDLRGRLLTRIRNDGARFLYEYDEVGQLIKETQDDRTITRRYDIQGRLIAELSGEGSAALRALDIPSYAQIEEIWLQYGTKYGYDAAGRRIHSIDANGLKTLYYYNAIGGLTHVVNALGEVFLTSRDSLNRTTSDVRFVNRIDSQTLAGLTGGLSSGIELGPLRVQMSPGDDLQTNYWYSYDGSLESVTHSDSNSSGQVFSVSHHGDLRLSGTTYGTSYNEWQYENRRYDRLGNHVSTISQVQSDSGIDIFARQLEQKTVDAFGRVVHISRFGFRPFQARQYSFAYDRLGRVVTQTDAETKSSITTYDAFGNTLTQSDKSGNVTTFQYTPFNREITMTTPEGVVTRTQTNSFGQTISIENVAAGQFTEYIYDKNGNLIETRRSVRNATGQLEELIEQNVYDKANRLVDTIDANGNVVHMDYDLANRVLKRTVDPGGLNLSTSYAYDGRGLAVQVTDPYGTVTENQYDNKGQKVSVVVDKGGLNLKTLYSYDRAGNVLEVREGIKVVNGADDTTDQRVTLYTYDAFSRLTKTVVDPDGLKITTDYKYDGFDNLILKTDPNGNQTRYVYDKENRLTHTVDATGAVTENVYDADGNVIQTKQYANAIAQNAAAKVWFRSQTNSSISKNLGTFSAGDVVTATVRFKSATDVPGQIFLGDAYGPDPYDNAVGTATLGTRDADGWQTLTVTRTMSHDDDMWVFLYGNTLYGADSDATHFAGQSVVYDDLVITSVQRGTVLSDGFEAIPTDRWLDSAAWNVDDGAVEQTHEVQLDPSVLTDDQIRSALVANASRDRVTSYVLDKDGRRTHVVDATGGVTNYRYDAAGNVIETIWYARPIAAALPAVLSAGWIEQNITGDVNEDRSTRYVYDEANRLRFSVDALGGVVETVYDKNGNVARTIAYANRINPQDIADTTKASDARSLVDQTNSGTLAYAAARETLYTYDRANRVVYTAQALWTDTSNADAPVKYFTVTETNYAPPRRVRDNTVSHATEVTRLASGVALQDQALVPNLQAVAEKVGAAMNSAVDRVSRTEYDHAGRITRSEDGEKFFETYEYDAAGNRTALVNKNRDRFEYVYDKANRLITEYSPVYTAYTVDNDLTVSDGIAVRMLTMLTYDALGNLLRRVQATDALGAENSQATFYSYDRLGRQTRVDYEGVGVYDSGYDYLTDSEIRRAESKQYLYTQTRYNVFGEAVANQDVSGNYSYKTYDRLGRMVYEVDQENQVTKHEYDVFGLRNRQMLTRMGGTAYMPAGSAQPSEQSIADAAEFASSASNRRVFTAQNRLGLDFYITEPDTEFAVDSVTGQSGQWERRRTYDYNTFGEVAVASELINPISETYATKQFFYDLKGGLNATVDAEGYYTQYWKNAFGEDFQVREYAKSLSQGPLVDTNPQTAPEGSAIGYDRTYTFEYDRNGNKVSESLLNAVFAKNDPASGKAVQYVGNRSTNYVFDGVGNTISSKEAVHNLDGQLIELGKESTNFYDALGRLQATVDALGRTTQFDRDAQGNTIRTTKFYNTAPNIAGMPYTAPTSSILDQVSISIYDKLDRVVRTADAITSSTWSNKFFSYDAKGNVAKEWAPFTHTERFRYDPAAQEGVSFNDEGILVDANGNPVVDANGNPIDPTPYWVENEHTRYAARLFSYDKVGRQIQTDTLYQHDWSDPMAYSGEMVVYNAFGEITSKLRDFWEYASYEYDRAGRIWRSNADGAWKIYAYDLQGNVARESIAPITNLGGAEITSAAQVPLAADVRTTYNTFDLNGRLIKQVQPSFVGTDESYGFSGVDNGLSVNLTPTVYVTNDRWGNVLSTTSARYALWKTDYQYDASNKVIKETRPLVWVYGENGQTGPGQVNTFTASFYDPWGHLLGYQDANGNNSQNYYNRAGDLVQEQRADGSTLFYEYDSLGRNTRKFEGWGGGRDYRYVYDRLNRKVADFVYNFELIGGEFQQVSYYLGGSNYDELGHKVAEFSGRDDAVAFQVRRYTYDARGNVISMTLPMEQITKYKYSNAGKRIEETNALGVTTYHEYDVFGRLANSQDIGGATTLYTYNNANELTRQTSNRGQNLQFTYTANGRLASITDNWRGSVTNYTYDADGNRTRELFAEGGTTYRNVKTYYDTQARVTRMIDTARGTAADPMYDLSVYYDANGNRRALVGSYLDDDLVWDIALDADFSGDPDEHRSSVAQWNTFDAMNRVVISEGQLANGAISLGSGAGTKYSYNEAGQRAAEERYFNTSSTYSVRVDHEYDFAGRVRASYVQRLTGELGTAQTAGMRQLHKQYIYGTDAGSRYQQQYTYANGALADSFSFNSDLAADRVSVDQTNFDLNGRAVAVWRDTKRLELPGEEQEGSESLGREWNKSYQQFFEYDNGGNVLISRYLAYSNRGVSNDAYGGFRGTLHVATFEYVYQYQMQDGYKESKITVSGWQWNGAKWIQATPVATTKDYDVNGNLLQTFDNNNTNKNAEQYLVTDSAGHVVQRTGGYAGAAMGPLQATRIYQAYGAGVTEPSSSTVLPVKPAAPLTIDGTFATAGTSQLLQLFVNDQVIGSHKVSGDKTLIARTVDEQITSVEGVDRNVSADFSGFGGVDRVTAPDSTGMRYIINAGDSLRSLANTFYGDALLWYVIADANGINSDKQLVEGQEIRIPEVTRSSNNASTFKVYNPSEVVSSATPELAAPPPPPQPAGCGMFAVILVIAVAIAVTALTAGALAGATGSLSSMFSTGIGVLGGTAPAAGIAGSLGLSAFTTAAVAGAVGSIASQGVAMATGLQDEFKWSQVGVSALSAGITAGLGTAVQTIPGLAQLANQFPHAALAAKAAVGNAIVQRVAIATHRQDKFDWKAVAIAAASAPLAKALGDVANNLIPNSFVSEVAGRFATGVATQRMRMALYDKDDARRGEMSYRSIAADAFGSALGNSIVRELGRTSYSAEEAASDRVRENNRYASAAARNSAQNEQIDANTRWGPSVGAAAKEESQRLLDALSQAYARDSGGLQGSAMVARASSGTYQDIPYDAITPDGWKTNELGEGRITRPPLVEVIGSRSSLSGGNRRDYEAEAITASLNAQMQVRESVQRSDAQATTAFADSEPILRVEIWGSGPGESETVASNIAQVGAAFASGVASAAVNVVREPVAQTRDLLVAGASVIYNEAVQPFIGGESWYPELISGVAGASAAGESQIKLIAGALPVVNVGVMSYDLTRTVQSGSARDIAHAAGQLAGGLAVGAGVARYGNYGVSVKAPGFGANGGNLRVQLMPPGAANRGALPAQEIVGPYSRIRTDGMPSRLYHYTDEAGMNGIVDSQSMNPSLKAVNPNDVRYGNGQYFSDIAPGTKTPAQLSKAFINNPFQGRRFTNYVEIDAVDLNIIKGRQGVYVVPNETPLDLRSLITGSGKVAK